jgi:hypothetical protein
VESVIVILTGGVGVLIRPEGLADFSLGFTPEVATFTLSSGMVATVGESSVAPFDSSSISSMISSSTSIIKSSASPSSITNSSSSLSDLAKDISTSSLSSLSESSKRLNLFDLFSSTGLLCETKLVVGGFFKGGGLDELFLMGGGFESSDGG